MRVHGADVQRNGVDLREEIARHLVDRQAQPVLDLRQCNEHRDAVGKSDDDAHGHETHQTA